MYKVHAYSNKPVLHTIFKAKLKQYSFRRVGDDHWICDHEVEDLAGVMFYKKNLSGPMSPLTVTGQRTERIV